MPTMYCPLCNRPVEARRQIGVGTVALAVLSWGLWLLAIPFYQKRCSICKSPSVTALHRDEELTTRSRGGPLGEPEQRLRLMESELEVAHDAIQRVTTERDFYRQLLEDPAARRTERPDTERPDTERPDTERPDTERPDTERPDTERPDTG